MKYGHWVPMFFGTVMVLGSCGQEPVSPAAAEGKRTALLSEVEAPTMIGICHFPRHEGDFVLYYQIPGGTNWLCRGDDGHTDPPPDGPNASGDGIVMYVSLKACREGHNAAEYAGQTCESVAADN
jgi:hypothetical protein